MEPAPTRATDRLQGLEKVGTKSARAASFLLDGGMPLHVLQELGGWESVEMVRRFAHLSSDHLVEYVDRMSGSLKAVNRSEGVTNQLGRQNDRRLQHCKPLI